MCNISFHPLQMNGKLLINSGLMTASLLVQGCARNEDFPFLNPEKILLICCFILMVSDLFWGF